MASFFSKAVRVLSDIYILGLIVFAVKFAWQIALLCYRSYTRPAIREGRFRIVQTDSERGPCTFANTIFVNPTFRQHSFFLQNIKKEYIAMLQRNGLTPIGQRDLISLSARRIDEPFLKYWKTSGIVDAATPRNLLSLKSQHIDADYVDDLKKAGYSNLTVQQLIRLKYQHIDGNYVRSMSAGSSAAISPEELVSYKATHVDSGWLDSLRKVPGYDHLDLSEIRSLSNARVSVSYIKSWQAAGFSDIAPRTVMTLKMRHMTPELAKSFRTLGYSDLDLNRLASLQNVGITPEFVTAFHKIGYDDIPFSLLYQLKTNGIDADYVAKMKEKGFNSTDLNKYVRLKRDFN